MKTIFALFRLDLKQWNAFELYLLTVVIQYETVNRTFYMGRTFYMVRVFYMVRAFYMVMGFDLMM
jgi:hypothetical protein